MGLIKEFKDFAMKGNVVDMAVGIIIGAAFAMIKIMNTAKAKFEKQAAAAPAVPATPPENILLLREIRDALKKK